MVFDKEKWRLSILESAHPKIHDVIANVFNCLKITQIITFDVVTDSTSKLIAFCCVVKYLLLNNLEEHQYF